MLQNNSGLRPRFLGRGVVVSCTWLMHSKGSAFTHLYLFLFFSLSLFLFLHLFLLLLLFSFSFSFSFSFFLLFRPSRLIGALCFGRDLGQKVLRYLASRLLEALSIARGFKKSISFSLFLFLSFYLIFFSFCHILLFFLFFFFFFFSFFLFFFFFFFFPSTSLPLLGL